MPEKQFASSKVANKYILFNSLLSRKQKIDVQ